MRVVEFEYDVGDQVRLAKEKDVLGIVWELLYTNRYIMYRVRFQRFFETRFDIFLESELEPVREDDGGKD